MITTRTRLLSILATVAMFVSMLACVIIPTAAAEEEAYTAKQGAKALYDAINWTGNADLRAAVKASYGEGNYAQTKTLIIDGLKGKDGNGADLAAPLAWLAFDGEDVAFPRYLYHKEFEDAGYDCKNWSISDPLDWKEMGVVANASDPGNYFENVTFHLTKNIDFAQEYNSDASDEMVEFVNYMRPLGCKGTYDDPDTFRVFAGTINGHGYGFENIYILGYGSAGAYIHNWVGLISVLGDCEFIDFGINSGVIYSASGNGSSNTSSFGNVIAENAATFTRVWSGATLKAISHNHISALAGTYGNVAYAVNVNGFVFYGEAGYRTTAGSRRMGYAVYGGNKAAPADISSFANIVTYPTVTTKNIPFALFGFSSTDAYNKLKSEGKLKNVYGIGLTDAYRAVSGIDFNKGATGQVYVKEADEKVDISFKEAAYRINKNPTNGQGETPVYFTLKGDNIRPVASAENMIIKGTVTGSAEAEIFVNANEELTFERLAEMLGKNAADIAAVSVNGTPVSGTSFVPTEDFAASIIICSHPETALKNIENTNTHATFCNECNMQLSDAENCSAAAWDHFEEAYISEGALVAKHTGVCSCQNVLVEDCAATLIDNADDCTKAAKYTFSCGREDFVFEEARAEHELCDWTAEGATEGRECKTCSFCTLKIERSIAKITVSSPEGEIYAGDEFEITVSLDVPMQTVGIRLEPSAGYTIQSVESADFAYNEGVLSFSGNEAKTGTAVVKVKADRYAAVANGVIIAETIVAMDELGDAKNAIGIANATLAIRQGDANANGEIDLVDAVGALRKSVGKSEKVNVAYANMDEEAAITAMDALLIVRKWLASF